MSNSYRVQRLETMHNPERHPILLHHRKPARPIRGTRRLVRPRVYLRCDEITHSLVHPWRYRYILQHPRRMFNHRNLHGREEICTKAPLLGVIPRKHLVLLHEDLMHQLPLLGPQEIPSMCLVNPFFPLLGVPTRGNKVWRVCRQSGHTLERVTFNVPHDPKPLGQILIHRPDFVRHWFVLLPREDRYRRTVLAGKALPRHTLPCMRSSLCTLEDSPRRLHRPLAFAYDTLLEVLVHPLSVTVLHLRVVHSLLHVHIPQLLAAKASLSFRLRVPRHFHLPRFIVILKY